MILRRNKYQESCLTFKIENRKAIVTSCDFAAEEVKIPQTYKNYPVTAIGRHAFCLRENLKSVIIPNGVRFIGDEAFGECDKLTDIVLPDSIEKSEKCIYELYIFKLGSSF